MNEINKDDLVKRMDGAINSFGGDLVGLRTGRASTNMVDGILVMHMDRKCLLIKWVVFLFQKQE